MTKQLPNGRKSRSQKVDGYKRHILKDLELQMVRAVGVTRANEPEASVTTAIEKDLNAQQLTVEDIKELHIDRAYLVSHWVKQRTPDLTILAYAKTFLTSVVWLLFTISTFLLVCLKLMLEKI